MSRHQINIYDFDHTIYDGDCTLDFYLFCFRRKPTIVLAAVAPIVIGLLFVLKLKTREQFKQAFYTSFLPKVDSDNLLPYFWGENIHKIKSFYLAQKKFDDIIISASPRFILQHATDRLGVRLIASEVDMKTGKLLSKNCRGDQKVTALRESTLINSTDSIKAAYSDSLTDRPLVALAQQGFLVKKNTLMSFPARPAPKQAFLSLEFLRFIIIGGMNVVIGVTSAIIMARFVHPSVAFVIGYALSLLIGFIVMSMVVFNNTDYTILRFLRYCAGYIPNFLIQSTIVTTLYNYLGIHHIIAYCISALVAVPVTFIVLKARVFKNSPKK